MALAHSVDYPVDKITIKRDERQRKTVDVTNLIESIRRRGVLHPIIIDEDGVLIAGERRLTCVIQLARPTIPARFFSGLSELEKQLVELTENINRSNLSWQETASTVGRIHDLHSALEPEWTPQQTADDVDLSERRVIDLLDLYEAIKTGDKAIIEAPTSGNAMTILQRRRSRAADEAVNQIMSMEQSITFTPQTEEDETDDEDYDEIDASALVEELLDGAGGIEEASASPTPAALPLGKSIARQAPRAPRTDRPAHSVACADAIEFFASGVTHPDERYNFLHCDFPYGVELNEQANQAAFEGGGYDGGETAFWPLIDAMTANWDRFMFPSAHLMFWFSFSNGLYTRTVDALQKVPGIRLNPVPLVWHKTDNKGIIPDAKRGGRNTYEVAFLASVGDRFICKPKAMSYAGPTDKSNSIHTNEKPEPMLAHFFEMFVDEHTRMLDPTCGSGSSVRTAERLGAEHSLGLEMNPEFASRAQQRLLSARNLRSLSAQVKTTETSGE